MASKPDDVLDPTWVYRYLDLGAGGAALILQVGCYVLSVVAFGWALDLIFLAGLPILLLTPAAMVLLLIRLVGERNRPPAWRHAARAGLLVLLLGGGRVLPRAPRRASQAVPCRPRIQAGVGSRSEPAEPAEVGC